MSNILIFCGEVLGTGMGASMALFKIWCSAFIGSIFKKEDDKLSVVHIWYKSIAQGNVLVVNRKKKGLAVFLLFAKMMTTRIKKLK